MTFSDTVSGISSVFLSDKNLKLLSDIDSDILSDIDSDTLSDIHSDSVTDINSNLLSDIHSDLLSDIHPGILSVLNSDNLFDMHCDILSDTESDSLPDIDSDIVSDIYSDTLSALDSDILCDKNPDIYCDTIWHRFWHSTWHNYILTFCDLVSHTDSDILSDKNSGSWGSVGNTAIRGLPLRSGGEHCHRELAVERTGRGGEGADGKSNNPHLTGGEKQAVLKFWDIEQHRKWLSWFDPIAAICNTLACGQTHLDTFSSCESPHQILQEDRKLQ